MKTISKIEKGIGYFTRAFSIVSIAALAYMMLVIVYDVFCRFVFKSSTLGTTELVGLAETLVVFFAFGYTQYKKGLVHVTFFMRKLPKLTPMITWTLTGWISTTMAGLLAYASWVQAAVIHSVNQTTATLYIPLYPFYYTMAIGFAVFTVALAFDALKSTIGLFNKDVGEMVMQEWPA